MSGMRMVVESGFVAHNGGPKAEAPEDWIAWHFTQFDYLAEIIAEDMLRCDDVVPERQGSVANQDVKLRRKRNEVVADGYPTGRMVSGHVPFYFAAKSPMLFVVRKNFPSATLDRLVFLGVRVGDVVASGLEWAASNGNAGAGLTEFSTDVDNLGSFVDFDLLKVRTWKNIPDDEDRMRRRAAELLVHDSVPLELVSLVVARNEAMLDLSRQALGNAGYTNITYRTTDIFFN